MSVGGHVSSTTTTTMPLWRRGLGLWRASVAGALLVLVVLFFSLSSGQWSLVKLRPVVGGGGGHSACWSSNDPAWQLVVTFTWQRDTPPEVISTFEREWNAVADYVWKYEPTTWLYVMSRRDEPVTPVVHQIVERYANRDAYAVIHRSSEPFKKFKKNIESLMEWCTIDGSGYKEDARTSAPKPC